MARRLALPHPLTHKRASRPLELLHVDTVGPISPLSQPTLNRWLLTVLDNYSGYCWAVPLFDKGMAPRALKHLLQQLQRQSGKRILALCTDRGREFMGDLLPFLSAEGIQHQLSAPYEHQQNGRAEQLNRELVQRAAIMLHGAALPLTLWDEAAVTASMLHNLAPSAAANNQRTAHECIWGEKPDLTRLRAYGALCWVHVSFTQRPSKFSLPRKPGRLVGYEHAAYCVLVKHEPTTRLALLPVTQHSTEHAPPLHTQACLPEPSSSSDASCSPPPPHHSASPASSPPSALPEPAQQQRTGARPRQPPVWMRDMEALTDSSNSTPAQLADAHTECTALAAAAQAEHNGAKPISLRDALSQPEAAQWLAAAAEEMHSLEPHSTWELLPTPPGVRPLPVRWVFKRKPESGGNVRHKARLVAKGFAQRPGVDFSDVFTPVCKQSTLHALLAITAAHDLELHQLDVKTAFLNGELQEEVWMQQPEGFQQGGPGLSCRLRRAIYGLKQAPRAWQAKLRAVLLELGFQQSEADPALFMRPGECYVLTYVDVMLVAGQHLQHVHAAKQALLQRFEGRDMGEARCFFGQHIQCDRAQRKLTIHQQQHVQVLLQRHSMEHCKPNAVPLSSSSHLTSSTPEQQPLADSNAYSQLVGSLLYLSTCTRPNIAFATGLLSRFMSRPTQLHLTAAKSVLRYLAGTAGYGLQFAAATSMQHHHSPHGSKQQQPHGLL